MKNLLMSVLCLGMVLFSLCSVAQNQTVPINEPDYNKPRLFDNLPEQIPVNITIINNLLGSRVGNDVDMVISDGSTFRFIGKVVSAVSKYQNSIVSIVVRSTNFAGASLTISKITNEDGSTSYRGRIISRQHGDLYELKQVNDNYVLIKRKYYDLVNE